jgi:hypothetical protein
MSFQGDHIRPRGRMRFVLYSPAQARLRGRGVQYKTKFLKEMIALQTQAQKFSVSPFSKGDDFGRLF